MTSPVFHYEMQIKESHLDSFGHVNNATYLEILEEARWDFITKNGFGLEVIQEKRKGPVILEVNLKYKKEIKNREYIKIMSHDFKIKGKLMTLEQTIKNQKDEVACQAWFLIGYLDLEKRKLLSPDKEWLKAIGFE